MTEQKFVCPFCAVEFSTKEGIAKHLKKCEARPDGDDDGTGAPNDGINLFGGAGDKNKDEDADDAPEYCCPDCDYSADKPFSQCPKCGCGVDF
jgi:hypothetical protein